MSDAVGFFDDFFVEEKSIDTTKIIEDYKTIGRNIIWRENTFDEKIRQDEATFDKDDLVSLKRSSILIF